ncbi:MAG: glycosyltransferase family 2 protein [Burkholderia gladioli]
MIEPILRPANDLTQDGDWWIATGADPFFVLDFGGEPPPEGWTVVHVDLEFDNGSPGPMLYFDMGNGYCEQTLLPLPAEAGTAAGAMLALPANARAIRLDPMSEPGRFRVHRVTLQPVSKLKSVWRRVQPVVHVLRDRPGMLVPYAAHAARLVKHEGLTGALRHVLRDRSRDPASVDATADEYAAWVEQFDTLSDEDRTRIAEHIARFSHRPLISVLVPLYNTPAPFLRRCIDSVREQLYDNWELCLADDASPEPHVREICEAYAQADARIRYVRRESNGHIAEATNTALQTATGAFSALLDHDDELAPHALYMVAAELDADPALDMLFSDEDKIDEAGRRYEPWFKPDWNPDLMLAQNAVVHLAVYRTEMLRRIGGFRSDFNGSQDYDVTLRFSEITQPDRIRHIPFVLYHWRAIQGSVALATTEKLYPYEAAERAIHEHLVRTGRAGQVERQSHLGYYQVNWPVPQPEPKVALIIPTKDKVELLRVAVESILGKTASYSNYEIVVVNNRSTEPETLAYFEDIAKHDKVRVIDYDAPYSFAALNNWAVTQTDAAVLGFVNNDIEVIEPGWLHEMVGQALRPEVGSVGAKLLYPTDTIQHAGIAIGIGGLAGHPHVGDPAGSLGYFGRLACTLRYSAVTAACMLTRREVFEQVGGFDAEHFAVAFNDVDLGLRLGKAGYANVWTPRAVLYHHESASLGLPTNPDRKRQFLAECDNFKRIWADVIANDPYYNPNLTITGGDFRPSFPPRAPKPWLKSAAI